VGGKEPPPSRLAGGDPRSLPRWVGPIFLLSAAVLGLWTVWLTFNLPSRHVSPHWDVAWGGFDVMLAIALVIAGVATIRNSPWLFGSAVCAATLLTIDAWFDILTARGQHEVITAIIQAAFLELPLAAACLYVATREKRILSSRGRLFPTKE
jgi:hypothetical protein